jgi:outer membrane protein OmpA-like peptidoglycan-associated protein
MSRRRLAAATSVFMALGLADLTLVNLWLGPAVLSPRPPTLGRPPWKTAAKPPAKRVAMIPAGPSTSRRPPTAATTTTLRFESASHALAATGTGALAKVADWLTAHPAVRVAVEGHADQRGDAAYNLALSQRRAEVVAAFLEQRGVLRGRIKAEGHGAARLLDPRNTSEAWAANRRVVVTVSGQRSGADW